MTVVMSSKVEISLNIVFLADTMGSIIRDSSTKPVLSEVEGLGMTKL
jgi:hypothetical protein